jgi:hypothetical protein
MMSYNHQAMQDRFADRGAISWILDFCFQTFDDHSTTILNVGMYGLVVRKTENDFLLLF